MPLLFIQTVGWLKCREKCVVDALSHVVSIIGKFFVLKKFSSVEESQSDPCALIQTETLLWL